MRVPPVEEVPLMKLLEHHPGMQTILCCRPDFQFHCQFTGCWGQENERDKVERRGPSIRSFKLQGAGPTRLLGKLEASVMEALWKLGKGTVQDVCDALGPDCNYKTLMTVLNRLVEKGHLSRHRFTKAFVYTPAESRAQFLDVASRSVVGALMKDFGRSAIAQFVDIVNEIAPDRLAELEALAHEKRRL